MKNICDGCNKTQEIKKTILFKDYCGNCLDTLDISTTCAECKTSLEGKIFHVKNHGKKACDKCFNKKIIPILKKKYNI